jgi:hypothetical protein
MDFLRKGSFILLEFKMGPFQGSYIIINKMIVDIVNKNTMILFKNKRKIRWCIMK